MTTMPTLETLLGEDKVREMTADVERMATETYQPLLDMVIQKMRNSDLKATLVADVTLVLKEEDGTPVVDNNISFDIKFDPENTYDMVERVQRELVCKTFATLIQSQK